ncbi:MAG: hypothetical protein WC657_05655 [Candidatus Paceibacterota bacterium]
MSHNFRSHTSFNGSDYSCGQDETGRIHVCSDEKGVFQRVKRFRVGVNVLSETIKWIPEPDIVDLVNKRFRVKCPYSMNDGRYALSLMVKQGMVQVRTVRVAGKIQRQYKVSAKEAELYAEWMATSFWV